MVLQFNVASHHQTKIQKDVKQYIQKETSLKYAYLAVLHSLGSYTVLWWLEWDPLWCWIFASHATAPHTPMSNAHFKVLEIVVTSCWCCRLFSFRKWQLNICLIWGHSVLLLTVPQWWCWCGSGVLSEVADQGYDLSFGTVLFPFFGNDITGDCVHSVDHYLHSFCSKRSKCLCYFFFHTFL